ncbi:hypothetical protein IAT38_003663 [Cryptococcus sp. DSM 104549]
MVPHLHLFALLPLLLHVHALPRQCHGPSGSASVLTQPLASGAEATASVGSYAATATATTDADSVAAVASNDCAAYDEGSGDSEDADTEATASSYAGDDSEETEATSRGGGTRTGGYQSSTRTAGGGASATSDVSDGSGVTASSAAASSTVNGSSPSDTTAASSPTGTTSSSGSCECGYVLPAYDDAYFPSSHTVDFSTVAAGTSFSSLGLEVTDGWRVGSTASDGTRCVGSTENVVISDGAMLLTVPGGQSTGGTVSGAEVAFSTIVSGGVFTMEAQLDAGHGTCQSIFTYTQDEGTGRDEQDIEMLGQSLMTKSDTGVEPGIQLTNWDPSGSGNDFLITPFTADPTTSYHNYTVGWLSGGTKYYFDGQELDSPSKYSSVNPSSVIINNWSNGESTFTQGPPTADVTLKVKSITFYYQTDSLSNYPAYPTGCSASDACRI